MMNIAPAPGSTTPFFWQMIWKPYIWTLFNVLVPFLLTRFDNLVHIVMPMNNYT